MFETISKGFRDISQRMRGIRELNESNIDEALRAIRASLLEADVNYHVVKRFLNSVKERAIGEEVRVTAKDAEGNVHKVTPGQHFIKICQEELENLMGHVDKEPIAMGKTPTKIMLVGLQGSGKTTTAAKLAFWLKEQYKATPLLVAGDVYRPAAAKQLQVLGESISVPVYTRDNADPVDICQEGIAHARKIGCDFVIFDTAGRLAVDDVLMSELSEIAEETKPENILLVCDAMIGRDAVNTAVQFNEKLNLHGFIMTKLDGDARGGAALSIKEVTGKPIRFIGEGEQIEKLKLFRPEGLSSRILGFGDIVDIMIDFERVVDEEKAQKDAMEMLSGNFDFHHFLDQLNMIQKMGSVRDIMERMPFFSGMTDKVNIDESIERARAEIQNRRGSQRDNAVKVLGYLKAAKKMGKKRIIAETGAGQHGVATATACALMDMPCTVYQGALDVQRQHVNVERMKMLGATVVPVESGNKTLKDATNEAIRDWCCHPADTFYIIGSTVGPHPYPDMVARLQSVISEEIKWQLEEKIGRDYPDVLMACVGGGSNAAGTIYHYIDDERVKIILGEAGGLGIDSGQTAASMQVGSIGILHGSRIKLMQTEDGQIIEPYSISAGLDYPGTGPIHCNLYETGRAQVLPANDDEALRAAFELTRMEGIIPALESAHALALLPKVKDQFTKDTVVVLTVSGRGDKDLDTYLKHADIIK